MFRRPPAIFNILYHRLGFALILGRSYLTYDWSNALILRGNYKINMAETRLAYANVEYLEPTATTQRETVAKLSIATGHAMQIYNCLRQLSNCKFA